MIRLRLLPAATLLAALLGITACSDSGPKNDLNGNEVSGTVSLDGKPLTGGMVVFATPNDSGTGTILPDGTYKAVNVPLGACKVTVNTMGAEMNARAAGYSNKQVKEKGGEAATVEKVVAAPAKYRSAETSGLTFTPKAGANTFDIKLTGK